MFDNLAGDNRIEESAVGGFRQSVGLMHIVDGEMVVHKTVSGD